MPTPSGAGSRSSTRLARPPGPSSRRAVPPALDPKAQAGLKVTVQAAPAEVGIGLANWNWKVVRQFVAARCGIWLGRSACTRYLQRLGFVYKRPKKRLLKADEEKRAAF
jgi:transposase